MYSQKLAYTNLHKFKFQHPELGKKLRKVLFFSSKTDLDLEYSTNNKHCKPSFLKIKGEKNLLLGSITLNCASYNYADKFKILILSSLTMQIICQHLEVKQGERGEPLHIPGLIAKHQMETIPQ